MGTFVDGSVSLHYDIEGDGYPVLLLAPGGMRSHNDLWNSMPWNPRAALSDSYRLIGMDQRNAGQSTAPISAADSWSTYATDQLALLDHLGVEHCHVLGMCIGGPFVMALLTTAPERFTSAVMLQPAGVDATADGPGNGPMREMYAQWADATAANHPEATEDDFASFGDNMWAGEFVLTATREQIATCDTPMLVMMGNDQYHPQSVSREIAALAPHATLIEQWKEPEFLDQTDATIKRFLTEQTPSAM
jgi:pimeloyl-ACP methyl ester carboxylesterase